MRQKRLAGRGRPDKTLVTMKERLSELAFEAPDLRADRRLRHRNPCRGPSELPLLGHRNEVGKLPEVHNKLF